MERLGFDDEVEIIKEFNGRKCLVFEKELVKM